MKMISINRPMTALTTASPAYGSPGPDGTDGGQELSRAALTHAIRGLPSARESQVATETCPSGQLTAFMGLDA
jgi:hypothetical protein